MIKPIKALALAYDRKTSVNDAFKYIIRSGVAQMYANRQGAIVGRNPEFLHQMRVGMRRILAANGLFSAMGSDFKDRSLLIELHWLIEETSEARDWDVFIGDTLALFLELRQKNKVGPKFKEAAYAIRAEKYVRAREAVTSWRYEKTEMQFEVWLGLEPWLKGGDSGQKRLWSRPVKKAAPELLDKIYKHLAGKGRNEEKKLSAGQLHELRLEVKKMRYSAGFFAHLYPPRKTEEFLKRLENLQTILGEFNDRTFAAAVMPNLAEKTGRGVMVDKFADEFTAVNAERLEELTVKIHKRLEKFKKQKTFW